jgi:hypothetical protein
MALFSKLVEAFCLPASAEATGVSPATFRGNAENSNFAALAAIRRASSFVSSLDADGWPRSLNVKETVKRE